MAIYTKSNLVALYNLQFADNTTEQITEGKLRQFVIDAVDSIGYWQGGWDWNANSDALPTAWPVGGYGYGIGDRGSYGSPSPAFVAAGVIIMRIGSGTTEADFLFR